MQIAYYLYAALLIVGGVLGYVQKSSVPSLVAGAVCGALSLVAATLYTKNPTLAFGLAGVASLLVLGSRIGPLLKEPSALWPGGVLVAASAIVLVGTIIMFVTTRNAAGAAR